MNPVTFERRIGEKGEGRGCVVPPSTCQKGLSGHPEMISESLQPGCTETSGMHPTPHHGKHTWERPPNSDKLITLRSRQQIHPLSSLYIHCLLYTLVLNAKQMGPLTERTQRCRGESGYHHGSSPESPALQHTGLRGPWVLVPGYILFL